MTEPKLFFDTDCISAFLWTNQGSIVEKLYPGRLIFPQMVIDELSKVSNPRFQERIAYLKDGQAEVWDIEISSKAFPLYYKMTQRPDKGHKIIGKGEASALALAHSHNGIVASNNFRDISTYIRELKLDYTTTGDILTDAYESALITRQEGDSIWEDMLAAGRKLGAMSFSGYLESPHKPLKHY